MFSPGHILANRYEILAPLAEGGMGAVYRARRTRLGDEVAIKVIRGDLTTATARERFLRESQVAASLRHPAIVSIFDFDMPEAGEPYLVMELLSGPSLRDEIQARRLAVAEVAEILGPVCSALQLAHASGVVHRDIKPANIVAHDYRHGERVFKLVDFGIVNLRQPLDETRLTGPDQFIGTVTYAAPEQLAGGLVDPRSDVYSLAAVAFEMLTGHPPFDDRDMMAVVSAHLTKPAPRVRSVRPDVPEWLDEAIARGLAKVQADRWPTAAEFGEALSFRRPARRSVSEGGQPEGLAATYDLGERLGAGRLGSDIFRGTHRALGHPVAIRILRSSAPHWTAGRERFLREARALQVAHPSIIQVRDYGEEPDFVYLVTDFIDGPSVREMLRSEGPLPWRRLRPLLAQLVEAARVLHRRQVLLCGLNPEIMRITSDPDVEEGRRLMISTGAIWRAPDLLATLSESTVRGLSIDDVELRYVAPELLTGGAAHVRSDVFTLGALAYEMATGVAPFDAASMPELLGRMLGTAPRDPRERGADLPEAVAAAVLRALRPSPAERFADAKALGRAIL